MTELEIQRCEACGIALFPDRLRCPSCGDASVKRQPAGPGRVEEATQVRHPPEQSADPVKLGSVRLKAGPVVIARLAEETGTDAVVRLEVTPDGAICARLSDDT